MRIGAQVRAGSGLVGALAKGRAIGAQVVQVFTQSPRVWKPTQYAPAVLERYRAAAASEPTIAATYCHATYLINLATPDPVLLEQSFACLVANLSTAMGIGAAGLVLHPGSHRGVGFENCSDQVAEMLVRALDTARDPLDGRRRASHGDGQPCPILLENTAGAGGTIGRDFDELGEILARAQAGPALGVCLDTQHLWAAGVGFGSPGAADAVVTTIDRTVGVDALACLHLNDSKVQLGAHRDRHANVGEGCIGSAALGCLLAHPALQDRPAILEVPGDGRGPRAEDVEAAHGAIAAGRRRWGAMSAGARVTRHRSGVPTGQNAGDVAVGVARDAG